MVAVNQVKAKNNIDIIVFKISGDINFESSLEIESLINTHINNGSIFLILDLMEANLITSVGLRVFICAFKRLMTLNGKMIFVNLSPRIRQTLEITELLNIFEIRENMDNAIKAINNE